MKKLIYLLVIISSTYADNNVTISCKDYKGEEKVQCELKKYLSKIKDYKGSGRAPASIAPASMNTVQKK